MSLNAEDLLAIRNIVREEVGLVVGPIYNKVETLENDIKEIYFMLSEQGRQSRSIAMQTGKNI
jgi:hypothetical protein